MPFDPAKPADGSPLVSAEMRSQLTALNAEILQRATSAELAAGIAGTSANSNNVGLLTQAADLNYNQNQMQAVMDKIDELINALRR